MLTARRRQLGEIDNGLGHINGLGRAEPVVSELTNARSRVVTEHGLQCLTHQSMSSGLSGRAHVLIEGALNEGMGKAVATWGIWLFSHKGNCRRLVELVEQLVLRGASGQGQEIEIEVSTDDRRQ